MAKPEALKLSDDSNTRLRTPDLQSKHSPSTRQLTHHICSMRVHRLFYLWRPSATASPAMPAPTTTMSATPSMLAAHLTVPTMEIVREGVATLDLR
ncbi:hypothetical protein BHE74_00026916 [Ensete ventricosum]|uniref:Uncharacterized protein n=1 Tax=Ensete ventricosum TaxID=4639 RepID=A0A444FFG2_ENSVE|nr:hypothetical protein GW17_00014493 [Ensete ventricosum]RWW65782.1 hypothetical protein BHE74_00026916 [Ensete ventricosum]RZR74746.1 hypothetical protein BHM03_00042369 [Ensete ventricosum]